MAESLEENAIIYVCIYDSNNCLVSAVSQPYVPNGINSFELTRDAKAKMVKIFAWENMVPVANVYENEL